MCFLWREVFVMYRKTCFHKYYMKNKCSLEEVYLKVEQSIPKHKLVTEAVAPLNVFSGKRKKEM